MATRPWRDGQDVLSVALRHLPDVFVVTPSGSLIAPEFVELQMNPAHPSLKMHRLDKAKDKNFWSARANDEIRIIIHRTENSCLLCYVDHHDAAYVWAERRKLSVHPTTGAAQMVLISSEPARTHASANICI